jgi:ferredoxin
MQVNVDKSLCRGHALCAAAAPELFEVDDAGFVIAPDGTINIAETASKQLVEEAVLSCPEGALSIAD